MSRKPKFTPEQDTLIRALHEGGAFVCDLARDFSTGPDTLKRAIVRAGGTPRNDAAKTIARARRRSERVSLAELIRLNSEGLTPNQIASKAGITANAVRVRLDREGLYRPRPHGQNSRATGQYIDPGGYLQVQVSDKWEFFQAMSRPGNRWADESQGYVLQHRKVLADSLGRALNADETVHHRDGDKLNNEISNLQLRAGRHGKGVVLRCRSCGSGDIQTEDL